VRNEANEKLGTLVGDWKLTMTDAWFLESPDIKGEGSATNPRRSPSPRHRTS
jgi:hypothetical protein